MNRIVTITCNDCQGKGYQHSTERVGRRYYDVGVLCHTCNGNGTESLEFCCCHICGEYECMGECVETPEPATAPAVVINGGKIEAPGFTTATFVKALARAQADGFFQMTPYPGGSIRIDTGKAASVYEVTRTSCTCKGHRSYGYCKHRAGVIAVSDLWGIDVTRENVLGFDPQGRPVTEEERKRQLAA